MVKVLLHPEGPQINFRGPFAARWSVNKFFRLFFGPKGCREIFRHSDCREIFQVVLRLRNILGCFVAQKATEKLKMVEGIFVVHLRPEGPHIF